MDFALNEYNNKLIELDSDILQTQIKLRELEIEKEAYSNAKVLLLGESTQEHNEEEIVRPKRISRKGYIIKIVNKLREADKRPYKIKELVTLGSIAENKTNVVGIALAQEVNKPNSVLIRTEPGVYGLKEFEHLFRRDDL